MIMISNDPINRAALGKPDVVAHVERYRGSRSMARVRADIQLAYGHVAPVQVSSLPEKNNPD